jgi:hypothetical protein
MGRDQISVGQNRGQTPRKPGNFSLIWRTTSCDATAFSNSWLLVPERMAM